ncbi:MAG: gliding motility-associated C-terminal domain-containing protein [Chitinophagaceae bacterium]|nr:gliding motility-associated C-terminal domain-containing protein [Chitinophagaceae bacterium]
MRKSHLSCLNSKVSVVCLLAILLMCAGKGFAQAVPELMYYKFNASGSQTNSASAPVGNNPSPILGTALSIGTPSQFGTALVGTGGVSTSNYVDNNWLTNLVATNWTISFWINNVPSGSTLYYLFGDGGNAMRAFVNGAPGAGNLRLTGTGLPTVDVTAVTGGPTVLHFVRTTAPNEIKAYKNGVLFSTTAITGTPTVGTGFRIGGYTTNTGLLGQMDEFRLYNRALPASEITATWNVELGTLPCTSPPVAGNSTITPSGPVCLGTPVTLNLTGNSSGSGQTYQWESSSAVGGPYLPFSGVQSGSSYDFNAPATSAFYRAAVTCGGNTQYSVPVQLNINAPLAGGTYTINSAIATGGTNFQSFNAAVSALNCGIAGPIVFNVNAASGPYIEQVIMTPVPGASSINTITFNGNGRTLSYLSTNTNERAVIKLNGADHVTFNNLVITATGTTTTEYGFGVQLMNNADSNVVNNCVININTTSTSTTNYAGIVISASATSPITTGTVSADYNTFSNNTITGGYYGITLVGSTTAGNLGNKVINNDIRDFYLTGVYVNGSGSVLIERNSISRPARTVVSTFNGIYFTSLSVAASVSRNRIFNPFGGDPTSTSEFNGIFFTAVDALSGGLENTVSNNLIYNINGAGDQYGLWNASSDNVRYFYNTISLDGSGTGSTASDFTRGFHQVTSAAGIILRNNIITINRGGPSQKTALYFATTITGTNTIVSNRNDLYLFSGVGTENVGFYNGVAQPTLANWQAASGQDANSVSSNPLYADVSSGNFEPTNASIDNLGQPIAGITVDIDGDTRSATTPDLGAYEFTPAVCTSPPLAGTATVSESPICVNFPIQLGVTGNSIGLTQTYQWQTSASIGGPYTNIGNVLGNPDTSIISSSTLYYRVAVTCSGNTEFSAPVLLTVTGALPAGTYTIDQTAPASPSNFVSFNAAKDALACGIEGPVVINVVANTGPYLEQLILDSIPGTSATKTITFNGNANVIQFNSTNTNERAVIKLNRTDYVGFYNLVITATGTLTTEYGFGVQIINNADNNTINNCTININTSSTSTNYAGIVINNSPTSPTTTGDSRCDFNTISFNTINGGYAGITLVANGTTNQVNGNTIFNNTLRNFYIYGIYINGAANSLIEGNNISRATRTVLTTFNGIYVTTGGRSLRISKNRIHNPSGGNTTSTSIFYGIYFTAVDAPVGSENIISNNAIYNVNNQSDQYGLYNGGSDNAWYYHNTISMDFAGGTFPTADWSRGIYQTTVATGIRYRNNLVTITRAGLGSRHAIYMAEATTTYTANNNNYYVEANGGTAFIGYNGANRATLADWQTASTQDANSVSFDPGYANAPTGDLKPTFAPLDNKGAPVGITTDIIAAPRSATTPDIGAWEFAVLPCTSPPVPGTASAVPNSGICLGTPIQLSLTGNSEGAGQTYLWEVSTSPTGPWNPLGSSMLSPDSTIMAAGVLYYRVAVTCSGNTQYSAAALVNINPPFPGGTYTIDKTIPTNWPATGNNFNSFNAAVGVMECGISGKVTFNVAPNTYTEQVRMHAITGTSTTNTVTFQSQNGTPSSVILTHAITDAAANYVLQLDSASYIIFKNMTITATGTTNARGVELARLASNDSLLNLTVNVPLSTSTSNTIAGIVGTALSGANNVIKGNTITNGSAGIYIAGASVANAASRLVIDSNIINNSFYYSIYTSNTKRVLVQKNRVTMASPRNATTYGIYGTNSDSAYQYVGNIINIDNVASTTTYGLYLTGSDATVLEPARIANNRISAISGNTGTLYGMYQTATTNNSTVNNVIVINTTGASSYGIYSTGGGPNKYYNNSVNSVATSGTNNYAGYFTNTSGSGVDVRNNIFSHRAGGRALYVGNTDYVYSDYNMLYTTGAILVARNTPAGTFATLAAWRTASGSDMNSIVYAPAFTSMTNLVPNVVDPEVWAIHGRGVQIPGNNYDFNNNARPTTVVAGVPDLGAYEFLPTSTPPVLTATPATPAAGTTQVFMFGTDTVTKVTWKPASTIPSSVSIRRYSGVTPPGMPATAKYMYFYTDVDIASSGAPNYDLQQFYIDPWQGLIPREIVTRLGRTNASNAWTMDSLSTVDTIKNFLRRDTLNFMDKFTGMTDSTIKAPPPPPNVISVDSSNKGTHFWVAYAHSWDFFSGSNSQNMVIYLSTDAQAANVKIRINGTDWVRNYTIAPNTVITTENLPKGGLYDARLLIEGTTPRGISIESDIPITAYAHIFSSTNSGATMLLPVGTYGYEYYTLNSRQSYTATNSHSSFFVIANRDSTHVEITPSNPTSTGRPANVPFTVILNRGEVYQVLGAYISGIDGYDMTGSHVKSVPNLSGKCFPIAVFAGSTRTGFGCGTAAGGSGDVIFQQVFPSQAWGKRYLTAPTSVDATPSSFMTNIYRVMVKDPTTIVTRNGTALTGLINGRYYQFESNATNEILSDKPVMVAQYMSSSGDCPNTSGDGDPEMFYLSPVEQSIKFSGFYRNDQFNIDENYLTIIIPTNGIPSLRIDGTNVFDHTYAHNAPGYSVVIKRWPAGTGQSIVSSDSAFTGIVYGLGSVESYGYNVGTLVKNLNASGTISNVFASGSVPYTCKGTPFRFRMRVSVKPVTIRWNLSQVPGLSPNVDIVQNSPLPADSSFSNGQWYYTYTLPGDYLMNAVGTYVVPISITHPSIEGCNSSLEFTLVVNVLPAPVTSFTTTFSGCIGDVVQFNGTSVPSNSVPVTQWNWNFGDNTTAAIQNPTKLYATPGTYNVNLRAIANDGCIGDTTKQVVVNARPLVDVSNDSIYVCSGSGATFTVLNPVTGAVYNWYNAATGGTLLGTGASFVLPNITAVTSAYVEAVVNGCASVNRVKVTALILPSLATPVAVVDSTGVNALRFRWSAVPNATGYEVSLNNGGTWSTPSSGPTGLTHTVTGLQVGQSVTLIVRALGGCVDVLSQPVTGTTVTDQIYIPNTFTPNNSGPAENERLRVYSNIIREMRFMLFNQWGEKIFESRSQAVGWDGTHNGKPQPSGVYMYVCDIVLNDGTRVQKKGSINLIR